MARVDGRDRLDEGRHEGLRLHHAAGVPGVDVVDGRPGDPPGHVELTAGRHDLVVVGDHHRGGDVDLREPRPRVVTAEGRDRLADRPWAGAAELPHRPVVEVGVEVQRLREDPGRAHRRTRSRHLAGAHHRQLQAGVEHPLRRTRPEAVGGRAEHQASRPGGVLAPEALGDDRAHRVARDDRLVDAEHVEQGSGVVGAVVERELVGLDAATVPALVEGDHPEPLGQGPDRGVPREQPGAAERVQQQDRGGVGPRARSVGDVGRSAPRQLQHPAVRDRCPGQVEGTAHELARGQEGHGASSLTGLEQVTVCLPRP